MKRHDAVDAAVAFGLVEDPTRDRFLVDEVAPARRADALKFATAIELWIIGGAAIAVQRERHRVGPFATDIDLPHRAVPCALAPVWRCRPAIVPGNTTVH